MCNGIKIVCLWGDKQPKLAINDQEMANWEILQFFLKTSRRSNEIFYSHFTPFLGPLCAMSSKPFDCDLTNIVKSSPKVTKKQPVLNILQLFQILALQFERNFLQSIYTILGSYVCNGFKIVFLWSHKHSKKESKNDQKTTSFDLFTSFSNTVLTVRTKFSAVILNDISVLKVQWHQNRMSVIW